ncbi:hypothetical protein HETIRDRAFT_436230 [Heterobasidion irregulare TC 32-1]|uniref:AB hydrolase-1 domain-containing protein n=1 Tax=Heterobasidion irregulare (strain TC 32-1) TaxID=747525 RepID=W4JWS0_HETIT|nr:uncharacterized protein HETIRDRAFT_436230 [Heterobasidion irregulare TC 32-1]ETW77306.1 hypothetical protein HETIRDRAFT_436230 [Heterobasidion irregulare TC 32-1]
MTKSSCLSYPRPESFQTWTPINPRPLLPIQPPPLQGLALPPLPSPTRDAAFGPAYTLTTHLVPSAFPRSSADIPQPQVPAHETKVERKARVARVAKEMLALKERQEAGESLGEGSRAVLWNSLNRYVRNEVGGQERHTRKKHLTLFCAHANGMHKETYEPMLRHLLSQSDASYEIDEIWTFDSVQHGDSGLVNAAQLRGMFDWADNARDILSFFLNYLPDGVSSEPLPTHLERVPSAVADQRRASGFNQRSLVCVGHSYGGCSLVMGAHDSPALFSSLILVDPVLIPEGYDRSAVLPGMVLAAVARRDIWSSREEAHKLLSASPFFGRWDPEVLKAYVEHAITSDGTGNVTLKTSGIQEAVVFLESLVCSEAFALMPKIDERISLKWIMPGPPEEGIAGDAVSRERVWLRPQNASNVRILGAGHLAVQEKPLEVGEASSQLCRRVRDR